MLKPDTYETEPCLPEIQGLRERVSYLEEENSNLHRLAAAIRRNVEAFEALLASSHEGIALTRMDGTILRVVKSVLGTQPDLIGANIESLLHPEDRETMRESFRRLAEVHTRPVDYQVRLLRSTGDPMWVEGTITDMLSNPAIQAVVHNYRDISPRKRHEIAAAEFMAMIEALPFAIFSKTLSGKILTWNQSAQRMFGYDAGEIVGQHIWRLTKPEHQEFEERSRRLVVERPEALPRYRTAGLHKDGSDVPIDLVLVPLTIDGAVHGITHLSYLVPDVPAGHQNGSISIGAEH